MARTVNEAVYRVRRETFLDVAQRLIQSKGYEQMSIQDVLDALDTSRGAFYHYFDSKQALLEAVVDRFGNVALVTLAPILTDPNLTAVRKLERVFAGISQFKADQKALVLAILDVWNSDANAIVREKLRRMSATRLTPLLAAIVRQGIEEGLFTTAAPAETATVLVAMLQGYQEVAAEQFVGRQAGTIGWDVVRRTYAAFNEAFERILGIPTGSLTLMDDATLHFWFG